MNIPLDFERELQFTIKGEVLTGKLRIQKLSFSEEKQRWECHSQGMIPYRLSPEHLISHPVS